MREKEIGSSFIEFDHRDAVLGEVTLELQVDWTLIPGLPATRTEPAEGAALEIAEIRLTGVGGTLPCPDEIHDAFVADEAAMARLLEQVMDEIRGSAEMAADDAAHAGMEPDF